MVPGFAAPETLLYSPELKFYSNRIKMDTHLNTNVQGLHCLGDSSGWTRGLMMASVMGVLMGRYLTVIPSFFFWSQYRRQGIRPAFFPSEQKILTSAVYLCYTVLIM